MLRPHAEKEWEQTGVLHVHRSRIHTRPLVERRKHWFRLGRFSTGLNIRGIGHVQHPIGGMHGKQADSSILRRPSRTFVPIARVELHRLQSAPDVSCNTAVFTRPAAAACQLNHLAPWQPEAYRPHRLETLIEVIEGPHAESRDWQQWWRLSSLAASSSSSSLP